MKILITGGAGYIGTELVHHLAQKPAVSEIVVYDNLSRKNVNLFIGKKLSGTAKVRFVRADILDTRSLSQELDGVDVVYHLAAKVSTPFASEDPHQFEQINHWGTAELAYALEESSVKKLIYLSSTSVYGASAELVNENSPCQPTTFYGISKLRGEQHMLRLQDRMLTYVIRCGNVFGYSPSLRFDAVINKFMFQAQFTGRLTINGSGKQKRSFLNIKKVTNRLGQVLGNDIPSGIYNMVNLNASVLEVASAVKEIYPDLEFLFVDQHMDLRNLEVDTNTKFLEHFSPTQTDLKAELEAFRTEFAF